MPNQKNLQEKVYNTTLYKIIANKIYKQELAEKQLIGVVRKRTSTATVKYNQLRAAYTKNTVFTHDRRTLTLANTLTQ